MLGHWNRVCNVPDTWYRVWFFRTRYLVVELSKRRLERIGAPHEYCVEVAVADGPYDEPMQVLWHATWVDYGKSRRNTLRRLKGLVHGTLRASERAFKLQRAELRKNRFTLTPDTVWDEGLGAGAALFLLKDMVNINTVFLSQTDATYITPLWESNHFTSMRNDAHYLD